MNEKQLRAELDAVYRSTSWKITAPLRSLSAFVQRYLIPAISPRRWGAALVSLMLRQTALVVWLKRFLFRFPRLQTWVRRVYHQHYHRHYHRLNQGQVAHYVPSAVPSVALSSVQSMPESESPVEEPNLSRAAQLIHQELKRAVQRGT